MAVCILVIRDPVNLKPSVCNECDATCKTTCWLPFLNECVIHSTKCHVSKIIKKRTTTSSLNHKKICQHQLEAQTMIGNG